MVKVLVHDSHLGKVILKLIFSATEVDGYLGMGVVCGGQGLASVHSTIVSGMHGRIHGIFPLHAERWTDTRSSHPHTPWAEYS